ncbi:hypothetical protein ACNVED_04905 [Legionella sp. D16C41]|uniref:hypothetical protein n=1 Tax=Legionella sp. D16C41 TaxID=3402688 RepID=UPI003AF5ECD2
MSDFKSKLPSLQELTHIASKLFKDVKNSVSEIIDEYKQKRAAEEAAKPNDNESTVTSSDDVTTNNTTTTGSASNLHTSSSTVNPSTATVRGSGSTAPITPATEAQTVQPLDEVTPTDVGGKEKPSSTKKSTKSTKQKQKTLSGDDDSNKHTSAEIKTTEVNIEHHVDEQKPLKDDVL